MRSTFKVLFYVNASKEKNDIVPIMGRVTINGSVAQFSCKQSIHKDIWDVKGNRAKGKSKESRYINLALDNIKAQIIKHYQRISDREAFVTAEMVRNAYQGIGNPPPCIRQRERSLCQTSWQGSFSEYISKVSHRKEISCRVYQDTLQAYRYCDE